jgi:hypothetical protein
MTNVKLMNSIDFKLDYTGCTNKLMMERSDFHH